ncbi:hypothetical protein ABFS82_12G152700 [Erythranthe guttata]
MDIIDDDDDEVGTILLPGFRFYPTQEELVSFYLQNKLNGTRPDVHTVIPVVNIYDHNPWDLPKFGGEFSPGDGEQWFFFSPRQEKEFRGGRPNRMTNAGYWKATGSPSNVYSIINNYSVIIGMKRTMVFYIGRAPNGTKTIWKMNEYKAFDYSNCEPSIHNSSSSTTLADPQLREEVSLCRIYTGSRSIRAFDRRPTSEPAAAVHHHSSGGSSSSSPPASQNINAATDQNSEGGEPCWDADQLFNWFFTIT